MLGMYVIQGIMSGVLLCHEDSRDTAVEAIMEARSVLKNPTFEGESVRVITLEGELVWDSAAS